VIDETFDRFAACGRGRGECVSFWTGPHAEPELIDVAVHPVHSSHAYGYVVDEAWLRRFWRALYDEERAIRAQAHTHPRTPFHSVVDDEYAAIQTAGFLSVVFGGFGLGQPELDGAALYELTGDALWVERDPVEVFEVVG
jgi:hypothetical protein